MNFAVDRDYTTLEMIQAVDNSKPQLDELVTFTTIIQNKGTKTSESIEVRLIQSLNLETINFYTEKANILQLVIFGKLERLKVENQ